MTVNDQDDTMHMKHVSMYNLISPLENTEDGWHSSYALEP